MTDVKRRYCQSCGMPIDINVEKYLGTNADHSKNPDFCWDCLENGKFTFDHSMEKLIEDWVKATDWYNEYAHTFYTPDEFRAMMQKRLPLLKRWRQKNETQNIYSEIINKIKTYINQNLFNQLNTDFLAEIAGISKYHFLRIFKSTTGETIGGYIQRLRLEYIAHLLLSTNLSLNKILPKINYQSKESLSKAFKKHFGISPSDYKKQYKTDFTKNQNDYNYRPDYKIKWIKSFNVLYLALDNKHKDLKTYKNKWETLVKYSYDRNLKTGSTNFTSLSLDDPLITGVNKSRFLLGITLNSEIKPERKFGVMEIPEGKYAVFKFHGEYSLLHEQYRNIYLKWLPENGYRQKNTLTFEIYKNTPVDAPAKDLVTEIYIPIEKI